SGITTNSPAATSAPGDRPETRSRDSAWKNSWNGRNWTEGHRFCLASSSRLSSKHFQQTACAFEGIFNAQLLLHQPDPRRNRMHDGNIQGLFHRDDILHLPRAGTEQINPLRAGKLFERSFQMLVDRVAGNLVRLARRRIHAFHAEHFE